jgi:hypothetical protein
MRALRLLLVGVLLTLFVAAPSQADPGNGAVVYRDNSGWMFGVWWNDYQITKIALTSSDPTFLFSTLCEGQPPEPGPEWLPWGYLGINGPTGKWNEWLKGPVFTRVYQTTEPVFGDAALCELLNGDRGPLIAEGISELHANSTNSCDFGPGRNQYYWRAVGNLSAESCTSGMAHFNMEFHYMWPLEAGITPECVPQDWSLLRLLVIRGPDLKCIGQK